MADKKEQKTIKAATLRLAAEAVGQLGNLIGLDVSVKRKVIRALKLIKEELTTITEVQQAFFTENGITSISQKDPLFEKWQECQINLMNEDIVVLWEVCLTYEAALELDLSADSILKLQAVGLVAEE